MTGYQIQTIDGAIGSVSGFRVDGASWVIREVVGEAGPWYPGRKILLRPENIDRISYEDSAVFVNLTKEDLQQTTHHAIAPAGAGRR